VTSNLRSPRSIRCLVAGVPALALAAPTATAALADQVLNLPGSCEAQAFAKYRVPARMPLPVSCMEQLSAARRAAAPARSTTTAAKPTEATSFPGLAAQARRSTATAATAASTGSSGSGFDWGSAAVGAAVTAGLLALAWLAAITAGGCGRMRTAR
jgi:hypothetical protein